MMKTLMILGSRNPEGQTATAADAMRAGLESEGAEVSTVFLPPLEIERCRQCDMNGWGQCRREGSCVIEDDFADVVDQLREADGVVFATPVYYGDLSESLRAFIDRLRRICTHEVGRQGVAGKPVVGICVAGGGGGGAPNCTVSMERALHHIRFDVVDMVPARRQNLTMKTKVLEVVGAWFAGAVE
jgi:multimeric flavodoxin WrbA